MNPASHPTIGPLLRLPLRAGVAVALIALLATACGGGDTKTAAVQTEMTSEVAAGSATLTSTPQLLAAVPPPIRDEAPAAAGQGSSSTTAVATTPPPADPIPFGSKLGDVDSLRYRLSVQASGSAMGEIPVEFREVLRDVRGAYVRPNRWELSGTYKGLPGKVTIIGNQVWMTALGLSYGPESLGLQLPTATSIWDDGLAQSFANFACGADYETVNGVATRHCGVGLDQFDQLRNDFGFVLDADIVSALSNFAVDVWISDEGYPMRLRLDATGVDTSSRDFQVNMILNITEINGAVSIRPPA